MRLFVSYYHPPVYYGKKPPCFNNSTAPSSVNSWRACLRWRFLDSIVAPSLFESPCASLTWSCISLRIARSYSNRRIPPLTVYFSKRSDGNTPLKDEQSAGATLLKSPKGCYHHLLLHHHAQTHKSP